MKINWVYSAEHKLPFDFDVERIRHIGPTWGSWKSWRDCNTDNVVCYDKNKCQELLSRAFQSVCNFYVPKIHYQDLGRPIGVKLFDGEFVDLVENLEDIITMHLVAPQSDIVLLMGYDLTTPAPVEDRYEKHRIQNRLGLTRSVIAGYPNVQWVLVDHPEPIDKSYQNLPNLTCDSFQNVLQLLM